jgi:hypothetical protein
MAVRQIPANLTADEYLALELERVAKTIRDHQEWCDALEVRQDVRAGHATSDELGRIRREILDVAHDLAPDLVQRAAYRAGRPR